MLLVGGGSGVVPLMAIHRRRAAPDVAMRLLYSLGTQNLLYGDELGEETTTAFRA